MRSMALLHCRCNRARGPRVFFLRMMFTRPQPQLLCLPMRAARAAGSWRPGRVPQGQADKKPFFFRYCRISTVMSSGSILLPSAVLATTVSSALSGSS